MNEILETGIQNKKEIVVTADKTATAFCSGTADVYATPAMIALMEQTAMESVAAFLPEGYITVGTEVHVYHLRATKIGSRVSCNSVLTSISDRQLLFSVEANDENGLIGQGTHTRYIVDKQRFMNKL
jgi:fluoroacetyl-CoA thioesterase